MSEYIVLKDDSNDLVNLLADKSKLALLASAMLLAVSGGATVVAAICALFFG